MSLLTLGGLMASADNQSTTMPVFAKLLPSFSVSTTSLDFGTWVIGNYILYSSATVTMQATAGTTYAITMDAGQHFDGVYRNVANGPCNVPFIIFDPTNSFLWGDAGFAGTYASGNAVFSTGTGSPQTFTAHGQLGAFIVKPTSPIGMYSDSVTVTLNYRSSRQSATKRIDYRTRLI